VTRANIDAILAAATAAQVPVLLVGQQAPGNFGPDYADAFNAIWPDMGEKYGVLWVPSFFVGLGEAPNPASLQPLLQPDGIHPNETGVARIVEGLGPYVLQLLQQLPEGG
jgi:acyl-CoA thioesterase-1